MLSYSGSASVKSLKACECKSPFEANIMGKNKILPWNEMIDTFRNTYLVLLNFKK